MAHPLEVFRYCPRCGADGFVINNVKSKRCGLCGFVYYGNPSAAVACFIRTPDDMILVARRAKEPAKGTLDLPGGFVDAEETAEEAVRREIEEETGLGVGNIRYLFSLPNVYTYSGMDICTLDMVFEAMVDKTADVVAADDVDELEWRPLTELEQHDFGLRSIREAVGRYKGGE